MIKVNMDAALKSAKAEADKKVAEARKTVVKPGVSVKTVEAAPSPSQKPAAPSLFDPPADASETAPTPIAALPSPSAAEAVAPQRGMFETVNEEDEILKEAFFGAEDDRIAA